MRRAAKIVLKVTDVSFIRVCHQTSGRVQLGPKIKTYYDEIDRDRELSLLTVDNAGDEQTWN